MTRSAERPDGVGTPETCLGNSVRERVSPIFLPSAPQNPDQLKERMREIYEWQKQSLARFGFLSDVGDDLEGNAPLPSYEQAIGVFSADKLEAALHFDEPKLILIPDMPFPAKIETFNAHKPQGFENIVVADPFPSQNESGSNQITGWRSSIVEGILRKSWFQHPDDVWNKLKYRMNKRRQGIPPENIKKGMDRDKWMMLMMMWLSKGQLLDSEFITILDEDTSTRDGKVMVGFSGKDGHTENIIWQADTEALVGGRFRLSVDGTKITS